MKKLLTLFFLSYVFITIGQDSTATLPKDTTWDKGGVIGLNFTQTSLSNWAGGGENAISGTSYASLYANYAKKQTTWDNSLDLAYGLIKQGEGDLIKSDDRIEFSSKFGQYAFKKYWYYSALLDFKTQFAEGYKLPNDSVRISNFLAPAYIILGLGMDYKPSKNFALLIAPVTGKMTIVNDQTLANAGAFGVEAAIYDDLGMLSTAGKKQRYEFGGFLKASYLKKLRKDISFSTKLELFSNYVENPENIDVNWQTLLTMKVTKFITVNFSTHLIYDDDIDIVVDDETGRTGPRIQFKQVLGVGLAYQFNK